MFQRKSDVKSKAERVPKKKSVIQENENIRDMLQHITHNSAVVLDLDNTVIEPVQELGSDQWFVTVLNYACKISVDKADAAEAVVDIYHAVQHHTRVQAVEQNVIFIIKALQDIGIPIFALTARGYPILETTLRQLREVGINFSRQWSDGLTYLNIGNVSNSACFSQGIIFCNGNEKGKCLNAFFKTADFYPQHVVMVDDKEKYLKCVKSIVENYGGDFVGLRYSYLDRKVASLEIEKATEQLTEMYHKLPEHVQVKVEKFQVSSLTRYSLLAVKKDHVLESKEENEPQVGSLVRNGI